MEELSTSLKIALADTFVMYFTAHSFHWNVTGLNFKEYHAFFGEIYDDCYSAVDPLAEHLRQLDVVAPKGLKEIISLAQHDETSDAESAVKMIEALKELNETVLLSLNHTFSLATKANEQGLANFLADRIGAHKKWRWQLKASV